MSMIIALCMLFAGDSIISQTRHIEAAVFVEAVHTKSTMVEILVSEIVFQLIF
jgi:hypothetical protein